MKAGRQMDYRKIDALVAEHVMECEFYISGDDVRIKLDTGMFVYFSPSRNISAAWQVVEKLKIMVCPQSDGAPGEMSYLAEIEQEPFGLNVKVFAETAPLAICLASLKAKGIDIDVK